LAIAKWAQIREIPLIAGHGARLAHHRRVALTVHISEMARSQLEALPGTTAERLGNHLKAIAELADLQPILYSGDEVRMLNLQVGDFHVRYSVDIVLAQVVVNEIRRAAMPGSAP
jgi:hypothetical protein